MDEFIKENLMRNLLLALSIVQNLTCVVKNKILRGMLCGGEIPVSQHMQRNELSMTLLGPYRSLVSLGFKRK